MKRDLQINYGILDNIIEQLHTYKNALDKMEASLEKINAFISLNEGESVEAWEDQVRKIKREIKNYRKQIKDLTNLFENYVERTTAYISPLSRNAMMRVDRNDIAYNLDQIRDSIVMNMQDALMATYRSPSFLAAIIDNPTDEDKAKSKSNELKLDRIRSRILFSQTRFHNKMDELYRIHKTKVIEFENTDDAFSDKAANLKNKYTNFWEGVGDVLEVTGEVLGGLLKGIFKGLVGLIGGILILVKDGIVIAASSQIPDPIEPDFLKKEADATIDKYASAAMQAIKDPEGVFEAIGQSFSDTYEKEGIAYLVGNAAPSFIPVAGVVGKLGKVAKVAGKVPASKTKGFSGNIKANIDNLFGGNKAFEGLKNRVSGQISSATSQFTKAVKAPFSNKFVQGALSKARSELAQVGRALGGLKIPVGIEKQVVSTGFNNITIYGLKTKTINDQFSQFAKVVDRVEGGGKAKAEDKGRDFTTPKWSNDGKYDSIRGYKGRDLTNYDGNYLIDPRLVVEMNFKGKSNSGTNAAGWERNAKKFFNTLLKSNPEFWSIDNTALIKRGRVPIVDEQFVKHFPQYNEYLKDPMRHHHIGEGGQAVALPKSLHPGYGGIHNIEKDWGITGIDDEIANRLETFIKN
ncbi:hypothetical protein [Bacillus massilinigeriensis]|uniref:hypothetical protein n=1 Tax=Bacillus mediterraneensis TaxID=1805474 RepID=UPI001F2A562F|nr:hypothetical protein [Bacillus mediterraneensis]